MLKLYSILLFFFFCKNNATAQVQTSPQTMPQAAGSSTKLTDLKPPAAFLVSKTLIKTYAIKDLKTLWKASHKPEFIVPINYAVDVFEIIYKAPAVDEKSWINCSGICFIPKTNGKTVPTLVYGHGTEIKKSRTINDADPQQGICMLMATDGYLTLFPDYYGMAKGDGNHYYQHAWSEAMSIIYMLYAVEELKTETGISSNGQLFITGYSEGGHAAFAAQKYLEELNDPRFKVTASVPMSGAYDMAGVQSQDMYHKYPHPFYLPYLITSYQEAYRIIETDNIFSVFKAPYDTLLPPIFGANRTQTYKDVVRGRECSNVDAS